MVPCVRIMYPEISGVRPRDMTMFSNCLMRLYIFENTRRTRRTSLSSGQCGCYVPVFRMSFRARACYANTRPRYPRLHPASRRVGSNNSLQDSGLPTDRTCTELVKAAEEETDNRKLLFDAANVLALHQQTAYRVGSIFQHVFISLE